MRMPAALPKNLGSVPSTLWQFTPISNSSSEGSNILFWPLWALGIHMVYSHLRKQNTYTHKTEIKNTTTKKTLQLMLQLKLKGQICSITGTAQGNPSFITLESSGRKEREEGSSSLWTTQSRRDFDIKVEIISSPFACLLFFHFCLIFGQFLLLLLPQRYPKVQTIKLGC